MEPPFPRVSRLGLSTRLCFIRLLSLTEHCVQRNDRRIQGLEAELSSPKNKMDLASVYTNWPLRPSCNTCVSSPLLSQRTRDLSGAGGAGLCSVAPTIPSGIWALNYKAGWIALEKLTWLFGLRGPALVKGFADLLLLLQAACDSALLAVPVRCGQ